jgi:hypothetical protein
VGCATPHAARGWVHPPSSHFKIQSCCCLGSAFEVAAFLPTRLQRSHSRSAEGLERVGACAGGFSRHLEQGEGTLVNPNPNPNPGVGLHLLFVPGLHLLARSLVGRLMKKTLADGHCCHAPSGCTPLHLAAWGGRHEVVQLLLDHKADHSRTRTGHTALHWAAKFGASTRLSRAQRRNRTKRL